MLFATMFSHSMLSQKLYSFCDNSDRSLLDLPICDVLKLIPQVGLHLEKIKPSTDRQ
jgi:hypothetical protein